MEYKQTSVDCYNRMAKFKYSIYNKDRYIARLNRKREYLYQVTRPNELQQCMFYNNDSKLHDIKRCRRYHPINKCFSFPKCTKGALLCTDFHPFCQRSKCECKKYDPQYHHLIL